MAETKQIVKVKVVLLDALFHPSKFGTKFLDHPTLPVNLERQPSSVHVYRSYIVERDQ